MNGPSGKFAPLAGATLRVRLLLFGAVVVAAAAWVSAGRSRVPPPLHTAENAPMPTRLQPEVLSEAEAEREAPSVSAAYRRDIVRPKPVQDIAGTAPASEESAPAQAPGGPANRRRDEKKTLPEIFRMPPDSEAGVRAAAPPVEGATANKGGPAPIGDEFAPFGRLVKCQLVDTLDSVTARSEPIVALVTEDLAWNGAVIIPSGTEAYSYARPEPVIDAAGVGRLVDSGEWTLVLPGGAGGANGRELVLRARVVDRRESAAPDGGRIRSWGLDDGADGLVGYTLSTLDNKEIKLFAAAAIGGMAQGFGAIAERQEAASGLPGALGATQAAPTLGNALLGSLSAGATDYMNQVVGRIRDEISRRGVYVRVPAGKPFYLFVEQTIDPRAAAVGLRLPPGKAASR
ncbi:MAG TPA: TrbI/VirB10 family protein [Opitutaceae bacterium]|nr:TrbI/VirB10 family protein [Opitutaceae bacterium]